MKHFLVALLLTGSSSLLYSQRFTSEATLPPVKEDGFYNILLTPEVTRYLKDDLSDIRLFGENNQEVPYILKSETSSSSTLFKEYEIVENRSEAKCCTHLILHNPSKASINNISLSIRNSDVRKTARLSGSDDKTNWYIIKDNYNLESIYNDKSTSEVKILDFPLSDYTYYKLDIDDSLNAPIKILKAGYYDSQVEDAKYILLPNPSIQQRDSADKKSYIHLSFPAPYYINKLKIEVASPQYYLRDATLCTLVTTKTSKYFAPVASLQVRSNSENVLMLDYLQAKDLYLIVENRDDHPLQLKTAVAHQLIHYVTAKLEKQKKYTLRMGNSQLSYPQYDLQFFKDSIQIQPLVLQPEKVVNVEQAASAAAEPFFSSTLWIWIAIVVVIVLLGFMSYKMIREIK